MRTACPPHAKECPYYYISDFKMTVLRLGPMLANKIDLWKNFPLRTHCAPTAAHGFVTQTDERDASVASIPRVNLKTLGNISDFENILHRISYISAVVACC